VEALRKRILREIFIAPSVVLPVVGGASAWLLSWAGGGNDWLNLAGLVGVLGGVGWFATRFIFQLDGISEKAMQDLAEEALQKEEKHLNELQKRLANDRDPRTEQYLILLRENRTELERIARTPGIELRSLEIVKQARQLFWAASDQLDQSMKMYELAQKLNGVEKQGVLAQRERCLEEARESSEHLSAAIATFRQFADKTLERDMDTLQLELAESIRAAKRSEERMRELQNRPDYERYFNPES
jgi:ferritin-like protein